MYFFLLVLFFNSIAFADTRTNNLPQGFKWRYVMDETEPSPRTGQFWRSGIILEDKIIVLNTHNLIALDYSGKELWKMGLAAENPFSEAKIHDTSSNEIVVVITDALLRINKDTGVLIDHYGYDVRKRSTFQFTELLPRHSLLYRDHIYVFLGPQLLSFHKTSLKRQTVANFNSSPKTLPLIYKDHFIFGFVNGFVEFFDPVTKKQTPIIYGNPRFDFSIRQPVIRDDLIFIPSNQDIQVFNYTNFLAKSDRFTNSILSLVDNNIWLRQHQQGTLYQIDETLSPLKQLSFTPNKVANKITSHLVGDSNTLVHIDGIDGQLFIIKTNPELFLKEIIYSEDFIDNPPLLPLDQDRNLLLMGGFDGLYLIDLNKL